MDISRQRWFRLGYGALTFIVIGFIYGWSLFSPPFAKEFGWDAATLSLTFTILMCSFCIGGVAGARIMSHTTPFVAQIVSATFIGTGFLGALLVNQEMPWILYCTYGVFGGLGVGMSYTVVIGTLIPWFPDRIGLASGVMLMCYSCSTMVLGSLASLLFAAIGWRATFVSFAIAIFAILAVGAFIIKRPTDAQRESLIAQCKAKEALAAANDEAADEVADGANGKSGGEACDEAKGTSRRSKKMKKRPAGSFVHDFTTKQMLKHPAFYVYGIWMILLCTCALGITGHANQIALSTGIDVFAALMLVSLLSLSNGFGRLIIGTASDYMSPITTMIIIAALHALGAMLLMLAVLTGSLILLIAGVACAGLGMSGVPVMGAGFSARYFGPSNYANNLAALNLLIIPAAFLGPMISSFFIMSTGTYSYAMLILAILSVVAALSTLILKRIR